MYAYVHPLGRSNVYAKLSQIRNDKNAILSTCSVDILPKEVSHKSQDIWRYRVFPSFVQIRKQLRLPSKAAVFRFLVTVVEKFVFTQLKLLKQKFNLSPTAAALAIRRGKSWSWRSQNVVGEKVKVLPSSIFGGTERVRLPITFLSFCTPRRTGTNHKFIIAESMIACQLPYSLQSINEGRVPSHSHP